MTELTDSESANSAEEFLGSEDAPTTTEYGLLLALIGIVMAVAALTLGTNLSTLFNATSSSI